MNTIPQEQLNQKQLYSLAAQRQLYTDAKKILVWSILITVPIPIMWSFAEMVFLGIKVFAGFWGVLAIIIYLSILKPMANSRRKNAAKIQEQFDCEMLGLKWSQIKVGQKPNKETITKYATKYIKKNPDCAEIQNWYPTCVERLPTHYARIICQRSNCTWDMDLRRKYAGGIVLLLIVIIIVAFLIGIIGQFKLSQWVLAILVPLIPAVYFLISQYCENIETVESLVIIRHHFEGLWDRVIDENVTKEELTEKCRRLQDEIYEHRKKCALIFDWIYKIFKKWSQVHMDRSAEALVQEISDKHIS